MADKLLPWMRRDFCQNNHIASAVICMLRCSTQHSCRQDKMEKAGGGTGGGKEQEGGGVENDDSCLQPIDHTNEPRRSAKPTCRNPRLGRHLSRAKNLVNLSLPFCPCPKPGGGEGPLLGLLRFCPLPCPCRCWLCCWWECATKAAYLTCKWALNQ